MPDSPEILAFFGPNAQNSHEFTSLWAWQATCLNGMTLDRLLEMDGMREATFHRRTVKNPDQVLGGHKISLN